MTVEIPHNLDNVPSDVDEIFKLLGEVPETEEIATDEEVPAAKEGETKQEESAEPEEHKDEKLVPLSAVFAEREKARSYREKAASLEARIEALTKANAEGKAVIPAGESSFTPEELSEIEEAFPAMGKAFRAVQSKIDMLAAENNILKADRVGRERVAQEDEAKDVQQVVQSAVKATPKLDHLDKTLAPEVWNARVAPIDDQLRTDPEFSKLTAADRFAKVVEIYEYRYGPVAIPQGSNTQARAAAAIKNAGSPEPSTLSDMPGGSVPDSPDRDVERMSVHDIANLDHAALERLISRMA